MIVVGSIIVEPSQDGMSLIVVCLVGYANSLKCRSLIINVVIFVIRGQALDRYSYVMDTFAVLQKF